MYTELYWALLSSTTDQNIAHFYSITLPVYYRRVGSILIRWPSGRGQKDRGGGVLGDGTVPIPPVGSEGDETNLPQWVWAEPGRQPILQQFQVKKAGLMITFSQSEP